MKSLREKYLDSRCSELSKLLVSLLPANQRTTFRRQDLRKLFSEAADLATNIRLSPATYLFACNYGEGNPLYLGENRAFKIINQASGQPIRSSDVFKSNQDGKIGEKLCLIHPALVRKGKESGRDVNLVKATMLCSFDYLMARRRKTKDAE